jgi:hypothetical protein
LPVLRGFDTVLTTEESVPEARRVRDVRMSTNRGQAICEDTTELLT